MNTKLTVAVLMISGILFTGFTEKGETKSMKTDLITDEFNSMEDEVVQTLLLPNQIKISVEKNLPNIYGNTWRFKQLFQNLIQNAIDFNGKEHGHIEVGYTLRQIILNFLSWTTA